MKMRNSYIANSAEALNLHNGTQTAIVVAMKVQPKNTEQTLCTITEGNGSESGKHFWCNVVDFSCKNQTETFNAPYKIGQEVYVRETWCPCDTEEGNLGYAYKDDEYAEKFVGWCSPATMPKSAARTRFKIVSCEAVRVKDITLGNIIKVLGLDTIYTENSVVVLGNWQSYIISLFGQSAWDNNDYIWFYKIEKI
jgi:hypothetical protein